MTFEQSDGRGTRFFVPRRFVFLVLRTSFPKLHPNALLAAAGTFRKQTYASDGIPQIEKVSTLR